MFKKNKKEKTKKKNKKNKSKAERIIGFIFVMFFVCYGVYNVVVLVKNTLDGFKDTTGSNSEVIELLNKDFDESCLVYNQNISGEDLASFYAKVGVNGANLDIFTGNSFDYSKYSEDSLVFNSSFSLSGNQLGVFVNNVLENSDFSLIERFLEIVIEDSGNPSKFYLKSIAKIDLSILEEISKNNVNFVYLRTETEVQLVGQGLVVGESKVQVNDLNQTESSKVISTLSLLLTDANKDVDASNYTTIQIKNFLNEFRKKTNCKISKAQNEILFSL